MKKTAALLLSVILVLSLCACGQQAAAPAQTQPSAGTESAAPAQTGEEAPAETAADAPSSIKIALVGPVTGDMAFLGEDLYRVAKVLEAEVADMGGINGIPVEFIVADDAATSATATTTVQKLIDVDHVNAILGPLFTTCVLAAKPLVNEAGVITITPTSADPGIFQENGFVFSLDASNEVSVHLRSQYLLEEKGFKTLAILGNYNDQTLDMIDIWNECFPAGGGEIVYSSTFNSGSDDFRTELTKIRDAAPDAIWIAADANEFQTMVRQMLELGMEDLFICTDYQAIQGDTFSIVGDAIDGRIVYAQNGVASDEPTHAKYDDFAAKWAAANGDANIEAHAALLYDCAWIVIEAMQDSGAYSGEALRQAMLANKDFIGVTGYPVFDTLGRSEGSSTLVVYENGTSTTLDYKLHD